MSRPSKYHNEFMVRLDDLNSEWVRQQAAAIGVPPAVFIRMIVAERKAKK